MLCILLGATLAAALPGETFTLAWTHSVEHVRWQETWRIAGNRLVAVEARIAGSGAGMEPPPDAWRIPGGWAYRPAIGPLDRLVLAASPYAAPYTVCGGGECRTLDAPPPAAAAGPWVFLPCPDGSAPAPHRTGAAGWLLPSPGPRR